MSGKIDWKTPSAICWILAVLCMTHPSFAVDEVVEIRNSIVDGNTFLGWPEDRQEMYSMGLLDGMLLAPLFGAPKAKMKWLERCITGMTGAQLAAMMRVDLKNNPGQWHRSVHSSMYRAMLDACPASPKKQKFKMRDG